MAKKKSGAPATKYTPEWALGICKEALGHGDIVKDECVDGKISIQLGRKDFLRTSVRHLTALEKASGAQAAVLSIVGCLKSMYGKDVTFEEKKTEELKDEAKRKLGAKAEAVDTALKMAGSTSKERSDTLKEV